MHYNEIPLALKTRINNLYLSGESGESVWQKLTDDGINIGRAMIFKCLHESGNIRDIHESRRHYSINHSYFNIIDSHEKAQILGMLAADGCISEHGEYGQKIITMTLHKQDREYLEHINRAMLSDYPLRGVSNQYSSDYVSLNITSPQIFDNLVRAGLTPRKSLTLEFPNANQVPDEFLSSYVCGYFEGDGSISLMTHRRQMINWEIGICVTRQFGERLKTILGDKLSINSQIVRKKSLAERDINSYMLRFAGNLQVKRFGEWIYSKVPFKMKRKYDIFLELSSHYDDQGNLIRANDWKLKRREKWLESMTAAGRSSANNHPKEGYLRSPEGVIYRVIGLAPFAREMKLSGGAISRVINGLCKHHHNWTVATPSEIDSARAAGTLIERIY